MQNTLVSSFNRLQVLDTLVNKTQTVFTQFKTLFSKFFSVTNTSPSRRSSGFFRHMLGNLPRRPQKYAPYFAGILVVALLAWGLKNLSQNEPSQAADSEVSVAGPTATQDINQELSFPLQDEDLNEVSQLKYTINSAELRDEIIVRGQRALAVEGRTFLILNIQIANEYNQAIEIDSRDYVRLVINGNEAEKLAPEIHNDPVEVQAISVKHTRLGFTIDDNPGTLSLQVGEIDGDKQTIDLNLSQ